MDKSDKRAWDAAIDRYEALVHQKLGWFTSLRGLVMSADPVLKIRIGCRGCGRAKGPTKKLADQLHEYMRGPLGLEYMAAKPGERMGPQYSIRASRLESAPDARSEWRGKVKVTARLTKKEADRQRQQRHRAKKRRVGERRTEDPIVKAIYDKVVHNGIGEQYLVSQSMVKQFLIHLLDEWGTKLDEVCTAKYKMPGDVPKEIVYVRFTDARGIMRYIAVGPEGNVFIPDPLGFSEIVRHKHCERASLHRPKAHTRDLFTELGAPVIMYAQELRSLRE